MFFCVEPTPITVVEDVSDAASAWWVVDEIRFLAAVAQCLDASDAREAERIRRGALAVTALLLGD